MASSSTDDRIYNSRLIDTYIRLLKKRYTHVNLKELLDYADMKTYQVEDEGHWFTQKQINLFQEKLQQLTGNKNISRESGQYAAAPEALGMMKRYVLGMIGPANAYELVGKYAGKFTKSSIYESKKTGRNKVEIRVTPREGVKEEPFQCEARKGYWDTISTVFNHKLPKVEHPECIFKGGKSCRYLISWQESYSAIVKRARDIMVIVMASTFLSLPFFKASSHTYTYIPLTFLAIILLLSWYSELLVSKNLKAAIKNLNNTSEEALDQLRLVDENTLLINEIGQALAKEHDVDGIFANVVDILKKRLDYDRGLILLANQEKTELQFRSGFGYSTEQLKILIDTKFHLNKPDSKGLFVVSFKEKKPFLLNDIDEVLDSMSQKSLMFARMMGVKSFICCPIIYENDPWEFLPLTI